MESVTILQKIRQILVKYKYAAAVVLLGILLMLFPSEERRQSPEDQPVSVVPEFPATDMESRLEEILSTIHGAGEVRVLLTEKTGQETLYQTDSQSESSNGSTRQSSETVLIRGGDNQETGLIRRTEAPVYQGAVIVCQGGDDPQVRLAIVEAVQCATGLGANQISVVKMK